MTKVAATVKKLHRSQSKFNNISTRTLLSIITIGWHHCQPLSFPPSQSHRLCLRSHWLAITHPKLIFGQWEDSASVDSIGNVQLLGCRKFLWNPPKSTESAVCAIFLMDLQVYRWSTETAQAAKKIKDETASWSRQLTFEHACTEGDASEGESCEEEACITDQRQQIFLEGGGPKTVALARTTICD